MRTVLVLAGGLILMVLAIGASLSGSPLTTIGQSTNSNAADVLVARSGTMSVCQAGELIPAGTSAVRLSMVASTVGPSITFKVMNGSKVITRGTRMSGWTGGTVMVGIEKVAAPVSGTEVCLKTGPLAERISIAGERTAAGATGANSRGRTLSGRVRIEYLGPASRSWWSAMPSIADRMGFGLALGGTWIVVGFAALTVSAMALVSWLLLHELGGEKLNGRAQRDGRDL